MFQFTNDCLLGVKEIDEEHRRLFDLLNQCVYLLENDFGIDQYTEIKDVLGELENYAEEHFSHEEAYMESICDPELILQRSQHMRFREKITQIQFRNIEEEESQRKALDELIQFLAKWLYHHIISSDILIGKLPPLEEWMIKENPFEFTEEYMIGVDIIDREHMALFDIMKRADEMVRSFSEENSIEELFKLLEELKSYTQTHFADEEEYMLSIGYEGYEQQKRSHDAFIARLNEISVEQIDEDPQRYLESLMEFLLGWLINHILNLDKKIPVKSA